IRLSLVGSEMCIRDRGYTARCLEIPAAISEGDTEEEALENIKEAIQLVLEVTGEQAQVLGEIAIVEVSVN
uniref:type II toxin-antitoxin system HicB family antitoxin n=1 Tax=Methanosarcina mazei TaxID=2209 RepID=UPI000A56B940